MSVHNLRSSSISHNAPVPHICRGQRMWVGYRSRNLRRIAWSLVLVIASALLLMAAADDPGGKRFDRLGHAVMCQCGCGQIMMECNHVGCASSEQMRKELRAAMDRGESDKTVLAGFVSKYGPTVLSAPTKTGFNLVAWIMPVVIFLAGIIGVALVVRAWSRRAPAAAANTPAPDPEEMDEFRRRVHEETSL